MNKIHVWSLGFFFGRCWHCPSFGNRRRRRFGWDTGAGILRQFPLAPNTRTILWPLDSSHWHEGHR